MNETAWAEIAEARRNLQPTPPVGMNIQWYQEGDQKTPRAGLVTDVEDSGRVKVAIFSHGQMISYKTGCYHVSNPVHEISNNPTTKRCGSWDYVPGTVVPKSHFDHHLNYLTQREANLKRAEEQAIEQSAKFAEKRAQAALAREEALMTPASAGEPLIAPPKRKSTATV